MPADRRPTRRTVLRSGAALGGVALAGVSPAVAGGDTTAPPEEASDEAVRKLTAGNAAFATDLHDAVRDQKDGTNLLTSPYSIASALAMVWAGARGRTEEAMADTLQYRLDEPKLHRAFYTLNETLESRRRTEQGGSSGDGGKKGPAAGDRSLGCVQIPWARSPVCLFGSGTSGADRGDDGQSGTETGKEGKKSDEMSGSLRIEVANALWGQEGYPFEAEYVDLLEKYYGAGLREVNFRTQGGRDAARGKINGWTKDNTEGRIEKIVPKGGLSETTRFVLTNAIYVNGDWKHPFEEDQTEEKSFTAVDGSSSTVPMMRQHREFPYAEVDGTQVVELPYVGGKVSMVVALPPEGEFGSFLDGLSGKRLRGLFDRLSPREGSLELPKFTYKTKAKLSDPLSKMGMGVAFSRSADFYDMVQEEKLPEREKPILIQEVFHKTFVEVDEKGAEAAGATAVFGGTTTSVDPGPGPFEMVVDRPFAFAIRDRETGAVLFFGQVGDAGEAQ